ncbi:metal ABC transporter ATP-binding protein [Furfurilactobacillus siliginis]|uniref:ABC transporter ATP-binding protein n=1 Tax=Furfurilactobacillus siliginis TaxID=348151 RepID=A0A0R2L2F5_9LACO|nr:ATP-binding cassette domain-containing protein [Furfurilactobacillus siliginis]KRN95983.1 zinc iron ABC transporter, ATP-binding protein [Furfurilactobacillus siliginis]GEK28838.1 ABC transporter ATP-binding protein [Furfurilactobacillus siliginis]
MTTSATNTVLSVDQLAMAFRQKRVFHDLTFDLKQGEFLSVLGENGVGKTTLVQILLGQLRPTAGSVNYYPSRQGVTVGYVPQFRNVDAEYPLTVREFVGLALPNRLTPWWTAAERKQVASTLAMTDLTRIARTPLGRVSGGELQKAYLAQALIRQPQLLMLDESTASLDNNMKYELLELVKNYQEQTNAAVLFVTHDLPLTKQYSTNFLLMQPGQYQTGTIAELDENVVEAAHA